MLLGLLCEDGGELFFQNGKAGWPLISRA
jgi:hypothetical protein